MNQLQLSFALHELKKLASAGSAAAATAARNSGAFRKLWNERMHSLGDFAKRQLAHGFVGGKTLKTGEDSLWSATHRLVRHPIESMKGGWRSMGQGEGLLSKAEKPLFVGFTAYDLNRARKGKTREERGAALGGAAGTAISFLAHNKVPFLPMLAGNAIASMGGERLGRKLGRIATPQKERVPHPD